MSRRGPDPDRVTVARLSGAATRHAQEEGDRAAAVAELVEIATERRKGHPVRIRVDLLADAAGGLLGGFRFSALSYWSAPGAVELLLEAGADRDRVEVLAVETLAHLQRSSGPGIGGP